MHILRVDNLVKQFSSGLWPFQTRETYIAVNDISFHLNKGEILGLLGPNGAGKTTTIQMLLGTLTPSSGSIFYEGYDFSRHRIGALKRIGYASGYEKLPARLSVMQNLDVIGRIYGLSEPYRSQQIEQLLTFFGMWEKRHNKTGSLSAGQATRVMLVKAFIADPEIVLLDEPTASLDPDVAREVRRFILTQRKERGVSMLITSHNMDEVTEMCDRVLVLKHGVIIADNTPEMLAQSISQVKVHLAIVSDVEAAAVYAQSFGAPYSFDGAHLTVHLDEHRIAPFLAALGKHNVLYSHISIDKPTLEDYFVSIAK